MKIYRYWVKWQGELQTEWGPQPAVTYGGSNDSEQAALARAQEKLAIVQQKIQGARLSADYEVEIREELIESLDARNLVTRNRYGALVLNSENLLVIDVDDAQYSLWETLKGQVGGEWKKKKILAHIEQVAPRYRQFSFRVYETFKGYRVLVSGKDFDARSSEVASMMKAFNADVMYAMLCKKQNCFRARLSPKPHRIKVKRHKVVYPRDAVQDAELAQWLREYDYQSQFVGVCKYIKTIGAEMRSPVIDFHDRMTRAHDAVRLA